MSDEQFRQIDYESTQNGQFQRVEPGGVATATVDMEGFQADPESFPSTAQIERARKARVAASRVGFCRAKNNTCGAHAVKSRDDGLCAGHGRAADKAKAEVNDQG